MCEHDATGKFGDGYDRQHVLWACEDGPDFAQDNSKTYWWGVREVRQWLIEPCDSCLRSSL